MTEQTLVTLRAPISNGALQSADLPKRLKILGWGNNPSVKGDVRVNELTARSLASVQRARGFEKVALDFEHNTVPGSPEFERTTEPRPVAAYGALQVIQGEGLFLTDLTWTPDGARTARNFADLSPAVEMDAAGVVSFVHSVALTRNGAVHGLSFFNSQPGKPGLTGLARTVAALQREQTLKR